MMRIKIIVFLVILVGIAVLTWKARVYGAERDCPMLEARHITSVRATFEGVKGFDDNKTPVQVNGTWDLPFTKYDPDLACEWSRKTPSGHIISLTVLHARHPETGGFLLRISSSKGKVLGRGTKLLSDDPYGKWWIIPISLAKYGITAGTAHVSAVGGRQEKPAAVPRKYVAADVARLRKGPSTESRSLLRLRINSPLEILDKREQWLQVIAVGAITGWIREELVRDHPLTRDEAWKRAKASTGEERIGWLERTVAIDPADRTAWTSLRDAYAVAGKKDQVKPVELQLSGRARFFVAECRHGMVILDVAYASNGKFVKMRHEQIEEPSAEVLGSFAAEVAARPWYSVTNRFMPWYGKNQPYLVLLPGTPFPWPTVDTDWNSVRLGRCPSELDENQILATAPFEREELKRGKDPRYVLIGTSGLKLDIRGDKSGNVSWSVLSRDDKPLRKRDGTAATWRRSEDGPQCSIQYAHPGLWFRNLLSGVLYGR